MFPQMQGKDREPDAQSVLWFPVPQLRPGRVCRQAPAGRGVRFAGWMIQTGKRRQKQVGSAGILGRSGSPQHTIELNETSTSRGIRFPWLPKGHRRFRAYPHLSEAKDMRFRATMTAQTPGGRRNTCGFIDAAVEGIARCDRRSLKREWEGHRHRLPGGKGRRDSRRPSRRCWKLPGLMQPSR